MSHTVDHNKSRSCKWFMVISVLTLIAGAIVSVTWVANQLETLRVFRAETKAMRQIMTDWGTTPPPGVDPHVWNEAVTVAYNAHGAVCYLPDRVSLEEMRRLREDMETKSQGPINLDTLDWLWTRLGQTGPHGLQYTTQMRPHWDEMRDGVISHTLPASSRLQATSNHFRIASLPFRTRSMVL
jgi:hypothetical protein